jgi:hypothetical protein
MQKRNLKFLRGDFGVAAKDAAKKHYKRGLTPFVVFF